MLFKLWLTRARGLNWINFFHWPTCQRLCQQTRPRNSEIQTWNTHKQCGWLYCVSYANHLTLVCVFWAQAILVCAHMVPPLLYITLGDGVYTNKEFFTRSDDKIDSFCWKHVICHHNGVVLHVGCYLYVVISERQTLMVFSVVMKSWWPTERYNRGIFIMKGHEYSFCEKIIFLCDWTVQRELFIETMSWYLAYPSSTSIKKLEQDFLLLSYLGRYCSYN